jgi:hypothetical protein
MEAEREDLRTGVGLEFEAAARRTAVARQRLAEAEQDGEILRRASATRGQLTPEAIAAVDRALGRLPVDPARDPELARLGAETRQQGATARSRPSGCAPRSWPR